MIAKLGAFLGIRKDGSPKGLLFPASIIIVGGTLYVTNLSLPLGTSAGEPEADVSRYTVSKIRLPFGRWGGRKRY